MAPMDLVEHIRALPMNHHVGFSAGEPLERRARSVGRGMAAPHQGRGDRSRAGDADDLVGEVQAVLLALLQPELHLRAPPQ